MVHFHPPYPTFTIKVCEKGILREPYRLIDVGVRGGLQDHWWFLGEHLEAWGFDPLFEEGVGPLIAANPFPNRIRYFNCGLSDEDGERDFCFVSDNPSSSFFGTDQGDRRLEGEWQRCPVRRLDSLFADGTLGSIDFMKLDAETHEIDIIRGAREFLTNSGIIGIESEANFYRTARYPRSHLVELCDELAPHEFVVYDADIQRAPRMPLMYGYPKDLGNGRYELRAVGRLHVLDVLFLAPIFNDRDRQRQAGIDALIKLICTAELYCLHDIALDVLFGNEGRLGDRLDVEEAANWLMRDDPASALTYQQYRICAPGWANAAKPSTHHYNAEGQTTSVIPVDPGKVRNTDGAAILRISHRVGAGCQCLQFRVVFNFSASEANNVVLAIFQEGRDSPVAILNESVSPSAVTVMNKEFLVPVTPDALPPIFEVRVGLAQSGGILFLNRSVTRSTGHGLSSYIEICDDGGRPQASTNSTRVPDFP
jgi:FkbM family methyltransferase